ncbi:hypothetical protein [Flavobacterium sp. JAS]|uniref:hypothetical protein n=1 Tax=Flavobacterium sp. JAS TaxID=2897329 RepID=UPI001E3E7FA5|nr:hypothetical protein [Flavobacterium sp. JAS]MCD0469667.1 hypothetical protein [Flavobacterium sp. JAS]
MKKLKTTVFVTLCMSLFLLNSCQSDSGDDSKAEASIGDYWPTAVGNQWVMNQDGSDITMKIISAESIKGDTYFKFNQFAGATNEISGTATPSIKKVGGDYYLKMDDIVYNYEGFSAKITGYEYIFFKDYLEANKTWTGNFTQETTINMPNVPSVKMTVNYTGTILEKGATATVNGVTYKDVIKFKLLQQAKVDGGSSNSVEVQYWVAKDVGVIKMTSGSIVSSLKTYVVKK